MRKHNAEKGRLSPISSSRYRAGFSAILSTILAHAPVVVTLVWPSVPAMASNLAPLPGPTGNAYLSIAAEW
jgi:hypothetical protein